MKKVSIRLVHLARLSTTQSDQLIDQLYTVHCQIFDGVSKVDFVQYVLFPEAKNTKLYLYEYGDTIVGYLAVHYFERSIKGKKVLIVRAEIGVLAAYRNHWLTMKTIIKEGLRLKAQYPFRRCYFLGCFVYPVIYAIFSRYAHELYPSPHYENPKKVKQFMHELADSFDLSKVSRSNSLVRKVGWITRDNVACQQRLQASKRAGIQFYLQQNPGYTEGNGLLTLFPISYNNMLRSIANVLLFKLKRSLGFQWKRTKVLSQNLRSCLILNRF